jgi:hypothetical protein
MMKARRGDIAVLVTERRTFYVGRGATVHTDVEIVQVTSITRAGVVKAVRHAGSDRIMPVALLPRHTVYVVSAAEFNIAAVLESARAHCWPGHPNRVKSYASLEEARDMLREHATLAD